MSSNHEMVTGAIQSALDSLHQEYKLRIENLEAELENRKAIQQTAAKLIGDLVAADRNEYPIDYRTRLITDLKKLKLGLEKATDEAGLEREFRGLF